MNPGVFNRRIKFIGQSSVINEYGGSTPVLTDLITTWGAIEPIRQYNQFAIQAGASVLNGDVTLKIRYRKSFQPEREMMFQDVSNGEPSDVYVIKSISGYYPGTKSGFQTMDDRPYQDRLFIYILGVKMDKSYMNLYS